MVPRADRRPETNNIALVLELKGGAGIIPHSSRQQRFVERCAVELLDDRPGTEPSSTACFLFRVRESGQLLPSHSPFRVNRPVGVAAARGSKLRCLVTPARFRFKCSRPQCDRIALKQGQHRDSLEAEVVVNDP
jgi:hypothetical protein